MPSNAIQPGKRKRIDAPSFPTSSSFSLASEPKSTASTPRKWAPLAVPTGLSLPPAIAGPSRLQTPTRAAPHPQLTVSSPSSVTRPLTAFSPHPRFGPISETPASKRRDLKPFVLPSIKQEGSSVQGARLQQLSALQQGHVAVKEEGTILDVKGTEEGEGVYRERPRDLHPSLSNRLSRLLPRFQSSIALFHTSRALASSRGTLETADVIIHIGSPILPVRTAAPVFRCKAIGGRVSSSGVEVKAAQEPDAEDPFLLKETEKNEMDEDRMRGLPEILVSFLPPAETLTTSGTLDPRIVAQTHSREQDDGTFDGAGDTASPSSKILTAGLWEPIWTVELEHELNDNEDEGTMDAQRKTVVLMCSRYVIIHA